MSPLLSHSRLLRAPACPFAISFFALLDVINLASSLYGLEATGILAVMLEVLSHYREISNGM